MSSEYYFDKIAAQWNHIRSDYFEERLKLEIIDGLYIKDKICADLGCGTGFVSLPLAREAKAVFSLDISKNMLKEIVKETDKAEIGNVFPLVANMEKLPLFNNTIDFTFSNMSLHHVASPQKAIKEMYRVLAKGGIATISDVEEHNGAWAKEEMYDVWLGFSHEQIKQWLFSAGFKEVEIKSTGLKCKGYSSKGEFTETGIFIAKAVKA
jgi:ubiquinone/menaquinone biosynthesis C-methylase UbiE